MCRLLEATQLGCVDFLNLQVRMCRLLKAYVVLSTCQQSDSIHIQCLVCVEAKSLFRLEVAGVICTVY